MCGIVGAVDSRGGLDGERLRRAGECLVPRGPDDAGVYASRGGVAAFAFRRLSIIDVTAGGHQPMASRDGALWIVFNGELYNFRELRADLESRGRVFRSSSDTEVVLQSFEEWGPACLDRFNGMFAFGIWNDRRQSLFLARDRLGIKPLYYCAAPFGVRFASQMKALLALDTADRALDAVALHEFLSRGYVSAPRSILHAVRALPPAHWLSWRDGVLDIRRYWDPVEFAVPRPLDEQAAVDQLDALVRSAVRRQLISDVPLGAFLSGGLDSSLVVAAMRAESPGEVLTFSVGFDDPAHDESARAAAIARHLGTTHRTLVASEADALGLVGTLPDVFDEPFADSSQVPTWLVSRLTRDYVTVALSGDGGDELFAGYSNYRRLTEIAGYWRLPGPLRRLAAIAVPRMGASDPLAYAEEAWRIWPSAAIPGLAPRLAEGRVAMESGYTSERYTGRGLLPVERMMLSDLERYLPNDILTKVDRASMAASLEARVPLLDHRIVEFALGLPLDLKLRDGTSKYLLRKLLQRYVPPALTEGPKRGFAAPIAKWLTGALKGTVAQHLSPERMAPYQIFSATAVEQAVAVAGRSRADAERVWSLLMFQMWLERYLPPGPVELRL